MIDGLKLDGLVRSECFGDLFDNLDFYGLATKHIRIGLLVGWSVQHKFQKSYKNDLCGCQLSTYSTRCLEVG